MAGGDDRLPRLAQVGAALKDAALARLRAAAAECRRIEAELAALDADMARDRDNTDPAAQAVVGEARQRWYRTRRGALNGQLARARVEEARVMKEAARAFGRDDALNRLIDRQKPR